MGSARILGKAIAVMDAVFAKYNGNTHVSKHAKEMGMKPKQYKSKAQILSESPIGGNIGGYKRRDGREVRYNRTTMEYVVFVGDDVITYFKIRPSQLKREKQANGYPPVI